MTKFVPPGVLVSPDLEILQFRGNTGAYLSPAPGRASLNLLRMLREGLMVPVRAALLQAEKEGAAVRTEGRRVDSGGEYRDVTIEVVPVGKWEGRERGYMVLFEDVSRAAPPSPAETTRAQVGQEIARLTEELNTTREYLQSVIEQQEASNEELQSANEEVQSANEELQSTNEELETSKEEIQSSNEELATVNEELNNVNRELSLLNDDLVNVIDSVRQPIVLLGADLRIRRLTPAAEKDAERGSNGCRPSDRLPAARSRDPGPRADAGRGARHREHEGTGGPGPERALAPDARETLPDSGQQDRWHHPDPGRC
jgi:two-component system CheB/CheR fusion protein